MASQPDIHLNPNYVYQRFGADFDATVHDWGLPGTLDGTPIYKGDWTPRATKYYFAGQKQVGNRCGLHALNAVHGLKDSEHAIDDPENQETNANADAFPSFPFYNLQMLTIAKNFVYTNQNNFPDAWPNQINDRTDETDPTTLTLLGRNRETETFPIRIDVHDRQFMAYSLGLFPLPRVGKWIISYPGHHIAVHRINEKFLILDSQARFLNRKSKRWTILNSSKQYVDYVQQNFGQIYSYIIFYPKNDLANTIYKIVFEKETENWGTNARVALSWGDFNVEKMAKPRDYNPLGHVFIPQNGSDVEELHQHFPKNPIPVAGSQWDKATYELQGLSQPFKHQNEVLLQRREYLEKYMDTTEKNIDKRDPKWESNLRRFIGEGRVVVNIEEYLEYSKASTEIKAQRRNDWMVLLDFLFVNWAEKFAKQVLSVIGIVPEGVVPPVTSDILLKSWTDNLVTEIKQELVEELTKLSLVEWEYIPLSREYFNELVYVVQQKYAEDTKPHVPSIRPPNAILDILHRWAPAGIESDNLVKNFPVSEISQVRKKAALFVEQVGDLLVDLFPNANPANRPTITILKVRSIDIVLEIENMPYLHKEFKDLLDTDFPGTFVKPAGGKFTVYVPTRLDPAFFLSEDNLPWTVEDLYDYMEKVVIMMTNTRWNPLQTIETIGSAIQNEIDAGLVDNRDQEIDYQTEKKWFDALSGTLIDGAFCAPWRNWGEHRESQWIDELNVLGYPGYNNVISQWLAYINSTDPRKVCAKNHIPYLLPIYHNNLQEFASLQNQIQQIRNRASYTTKYDNYETLLRRTLGTPNKENGQQLDLALFGSTQRGAELGSYSVPNPIPVQVWIEPEALDEALRFVPALVENDQQLKEYLKRLFPGPNYRIVFDTVWQIAEQIANSTRLPIARIWTIILKAYRRRRLPLTEGSLDFKTIQKIIILEQLEDVEAEIRKTSKEILGSKLEEKLVYEGRKSNEVVRGEVTLKTFRDPFGPNHNDRFYYYRWRFEKPKKDGINSSKEWYVGPNQELSSSAEIPVAWGDGILSCEVYILKFSQGNYQYVQRIVCPYTLRLVILHQCVRCNQIYAAKNNLHGQCVFHPLPNQTQTFLRSEASIPDAVRNWDYFVSLFRRARDWLGKDLYFLDWLAHAVPILEGVDLVDLGIFDTLCMKLDTYPLEKLLELLEIFPWDVAVYLRYGQGKDALPETIRQWLIEFPLNYVRTTRRKWLSYKRKVQVENPNRFDIMGNVPADLWIDSETSSEIRRSLRPMPYGYDNKNNSWLCCGKQGADASGCWIDFHSQKYPYVRFLGHREHEDQKGSWALERREEFQELWSIFETVSKQQPINFLALQNIAVQYYSLQLNLSCYGEGETIYWPVPKTGQEICEQIKFGYPQSVRFSIVPNPTKGFTPFGKNGTIFELVKKGPAIPQAPVGYPSPPPVVFRATKGYTPIRKGTENAKIMAQFSDVVPTGRGHNIIVDSQTDGTKQNFVSSMPYLSIAVGTFTEMRFVETMPYLSLGMVHLSQVGNKFLWI